MKARFRLLILKVLNSSRLLRGIYYGLLRDTYDREFKAVLSGMIKHQQNLLAGSDHYMLRRNTHRLEKGLVMQPRKHIFGLEYIGETVKAFSQQSKANPNNDSLVWTRDVLSQYFEVVTKNDEITDLQRKFEEADEIKRKARRFPYARKDSEPLRVSFEDVLSLAKRRRSVRWFSSERVSRSLIDKAVSVANLAPSACNRQPFEFVIFDAPEKASRVLSLAGGTKGFSQNVPAAIALVGNLEAYQYEADRHLIYIDGGLSAMSLCFGLEALGLGSCCINWPDIKEREKQINSMLGISDTKRVIMLIALGFPEENGGIPFSQKKDLDEIRIYET